MHWLPVNVHWLPVLRQFHWQTVQRSLSDSEEFSGCQCISLSVSKNFIGSKCISPAASGNSLEIHSEFSLADSENFLTGILRMLPISSYLTLLLSKFVNIFVKFKNRKIFLKKIPTPQKTTIKISSQKLKKETGDKFDMENLEA